MRRRRKAAVPWRHRRDSLSARRSPRARSDFAPPRGCGDAPGAKLSITLRKQLNQDIRFFNEAISSYTASYEFFAKNGEMRTSGTDHGPIRKKRHVVGASEDSFTKFNLPKFVEHLVKFSVVARPSLTYANLHGYERTRKCLDGSSLGVCILLSTKPRS